jgi:hypothetical protein
MDALRMFPISQRRSGNIKPTIDITLHLPTKTKDLGELQEIHKTGMGKGTPKNLPNVVNTMGPRTS